MRNLNRKRIKLTLDLDREEDRMFYEWYLKQKHPSEAVVSACLGQATIHYSSAPLPDENPVKNQLSSPVNNEEISIAMDLYEDW